MEEYRFIEGPTTWVRDSERLGEAGYQLIQADCETWKSELHMHESLSRALSFPSYYGKNLNALDDVITDADIPETGGLALILLHYDRFSKSDFALAGTVLDILSRASHSYLLTGRRFVTLVQSDDPGLRFPKVGGRAPGWNRREWLNKDRGNSNR